MSARSIVALPDPRLRSVCATVRAFDASLEALAGDLLDTLVATRSLGVAAPQIGSDLRLVVVADAGPGGHPTVFVNPVVVERRLMALVEESCLSIPGITASVRRAVRVRVRAHDLKGRPFEQSLADMPAVCLQHEVDHLDGVLFIDRLPRWRRWWAMRRYGATAG